MSLHNGIIRRLPLAWLYVTSAAVPVLAQSWQAAPNSAFTNTNACVANGFAGSVCSSSGTPTGCAGSGTPYPYQNTCAAMITAYSGGVARTKPGSEQLIIMGEGHGDGGDNSVVAIDVGTHPANPAVHRLRNPSQLYAEDYNGVAPFTSTVNITGTTVTWVSGTTFTLAMQGVEMNITEGATSGWYLIQSYNSSTSLTLYQAPGNYTGATLSSSPQRFRFVTIDGNPEAFHSYENLAYVDSSDPTYPDSMFAFGGSVYGGGAPASDVGWIFSFATNTWTMILPNRSGDVPVNPPYNASVVYYDDSTHTVIIGEGGEYVYRIDLSACTGSGSPITCTYVKQGTNSIPWAFPGSAFDTSRNQLLLMGKGAYTDAVGAADITTLGATPTTTDITSSIDPSCYPLRDTVGPGMIYDPKFDQIIGFPAESTGYIYLMNPSTYTCQAVYYPGLTAQVTATSTTSVNLGSVAGTNVSMTASTCTGIASGLVIRVTATASPYDWFMGVVNSCSGTSLSIAVGSTGNVGGSGTFASWNINLPLIEGFYGKFQYFPSLGELTVIANYGQSLYTLQLEPNGIGSPVQQYFCTDHDGDGYGVGNLAVGPFTDLAIDATTNTIVSSASHSFTVADQYASIYVTSGTGFTPQIIEILSVSGGKATLASSPGTAGSTGGHWYIGGCLGSDANDSDATVHTAPQAISAYGSVPITYNMSRYTPLRYWLIDPVNGNDSSPGSQPYTPSAFATCTASSTCGSYKTYAAMRTSIAAGGDAIVFRAGAIQEGIAPVSGVASLYNYYLAYPGEEPYVDANNSGVWNILSTNWVVVDGVATHGPQTMSGGDNNQIIIRHVHIDGATVAYWVDGVTNWWLEDSTIHDAPGTHGVYIGARLYPESNLNILRNLIYRNGLAGIHSNGRVSGSTISQNIIYSNNNNGIDLQNGFAHSTISSNLIFNNSYAIEWSLYNGNTNCTAPDPDCSPQTSDSFVCPYDQNYNVIVDNTIWNSLNFYNQPGWNSNDPAALYWGKQCYALPHDNGHQTIRNNILIGGADSSHMSIRIDYSQMSDPGGSDETAWLGTSTFDHNLINTTSPVTGNYILGLGNQDPGGVVTPYTCAGLGTFTTFPNGTSTDCQYVSPGFANVSTSYYDQEALFNFVLAGGSSAIHAGTPTQPIAPFDVTGFPLATTPSLGSLEVQGCSITTSSFPAATDTQSYSQTAVSSGCASSTWSVATGALPSWASLNPSTGVISGTASGTSTATFTLSYPPATSGSLSIVTNAAPTVPFCTGSSLTCPGGTQSVSYSNTVVTSGGTGSLTCAVVGGALPTGLSFSGCTITGTPSGSGTSTFTAHATDANSITGATSSTMSLTIAASGGGVVKVPVCGGGGLCGGTVGHQDNK